jgi:Tfp pilus assembly protein PilN
MRAVNLLPADYSGTSRVSVGNRLGRHAVAAGGVGAAAVAASALGLLWHSASTQAAANETQLTSLKVQLARVAKTAPSSNQNIQTRLTQINTADSTRVSWDGFMSRLSRVLPEDVWLTGLITANAAAATATPSASPTTGAAAFTITGYTYSQKSVARLMRRLQMLPWLNAIQLQSSLLTTVGPKSAFQFTITGGVIPLPAKEAS